MTKSLCCLLIYRLINYVTYISEFTVDCVVTDVVYMCLIYVKGIKHKKIIKNK